MLTSLQALLRLATLKWLGVFICALATLLATTSTASALEPAQTKTRVWGFDFAADNSAGLFRAASSGKHQGNRLARAEQASGSLLAAGALPPALKIVPGNAKFGIEHIVRRHAFNTVTTKPASKFAEGMGHLEIRGLIEEAARVNGSGWVSQGSKRVLETNLGRTIGTGLQGKAVGGLRIVTGADGTLITAYPIPFP